jgi:hypothetical protein
MGSDAVWICVGEHLSEETVRVFGTTTAQLRASAEWMRSLGVDTVALEATGVYWVAAYEIYEEHGLRPILINSQAIRSFNGLKKSDFIDCQWIQLLHTFVILQGAGTDRGFLNSMVPAAASSIWAITCARRGLKEAGGKAATQGTRSACRHYTLGETALQVEARCHQRRVV